MELTFIPSKAISLRDGFVIYNHKTLRAIETHNSARAAIYWTDVLNDHEIQYERPATYAWISIKDCTFKDTDNG